MVLLELENNIIKYHSTADCRIIQSPYSFARESTEGIFFTHIKQDIIILKPHYHKES